MAKFMFTELTDLAKVVTARLGSASGSANYLDDKEVGKFVKLAGESRYNLCGVGDEIEGRISSLNVASQDDYSIGGVQVEGRFEVTFDGAQATPATGTLAVGDYVVCGTAVAKGTALTVPAKVCKATDQAAAKSSPFACRVVSLGSAGTGAVGTTGIVEIVS